MSLLCIPSTQLPLVNGGFAIVDDADMPALSAYTWRVKRFQNHAYAFANTKLNGKHRHLAMHRFLMGLHFGDKRVVDHIDGNGLDNRRSNIRVCTVGQNVCNRRSSSATTGYKGVYLNRDKYSARIGDASERTYLGYFHSRHQAAAVYNKAATEKFGEYARLNQIDIAAYKEDLLNLIAVAKEEVSKLEAELAGII